MVTYAVTVSVPANSLFTAQSYSVTFTAMDPTGNLSGASTAVTWSVAAAGNNSAVDSFVGGG